MICIKFWKESREALKEPLGREKKSLSIFVISGRKNVRERGRKHSEHSHDFLGGCLMVIVSTLSFDCENSLEVNLQINHRSYVMKCIKESLEIKLFRFGFTKPESSTKRIGFATES